MFRRVVRVVFGVAAAVLVLGAVGPPAFAGSSPHPVVRAAGHAGPDGCSGSPLTCT